MMIDEGTTGTGYLGSIPWGTHVCEFRRRQSIAETLVPYFTAGVRQDELCFWVTSDPSGVEGAGSELRKAAPYLGRYLDNGQIEIHDCRSWYLDGGRFDADRVLGRWLEKEKQSLHSGYKGVRVSGETGWLEKADWPAFMAYEAQVNRVLSQHRVIALCVYPSENCTADAMLEVVRNHQFTLAQITGTWEMFHVEASQSEELQRLSSHVLQQQDEERRWIASQLHEVTAQNVLALAMYVASLQKKRSWPSEVQSILAKCHSLCEESLEQILALSRLLHPPILDGLGLAASLRGYIEDLTKRSPLQIHFETVQDVGRLPLKTETQLFRVAQEGLAIIGRSGSVKAIVRLRREPDQVILQIEDSGGGAAAVAAGGVEDVGLGILGMQERLRSIGGSLEMQSIGKSTTLTARVRRS